MIIGMDMDIKIHNFTLYRFDDSIFLSFFFFKALQFLHLYFNTSNKTNFQYFKHINSILVKHFQISYRRFEKKFKLRIGRDYFGDVTNLKS